MINDNLEELEHWMENTSLFNSELFLMDFLHGYCQYFALELSRQIDCKVALWLEHIEEDNKDILIHAFAMKKINNKQVFIDVRGVITDIDDIISEFDYLLEPDFIYVSTEEAEMIFKKMEIDYLEKKIVKDIKEFIEKNLSRYEVSYKS